jgi:hypothetical protein
MNVMCYKRVMTSGYTGQHYQGSASGLFSPTTASTEPPDDREGLWPMLLAICCSICSCASGPGLQLASAALQLPLVLQLCAADNEATGACPFCGKPTGQVGTATSAAL